MRISYLIPGPMGRGSEGIAELARRRDFLERHAALGTVRVPSRPPFVKVGSAIARE